MKPERILVHSVSPIYRRQFNLTVARALDLQEDGHEVAITYCDEKAGTCTANLAGNPASCFFCRRDARNLIQSMGLEAIPIHEEADRLSEQQTTTSSARRQLATAVNSNLITQLRLLPNELNQATVTRLVKKRYFQTAISLNAAYRQIVKNFRPARVEVVNGRHACSQLAIAAAKEFDIAFNTLEYSETKLPLIFEGSTPHDRKALQDRIKAMPLDEEFAENYFERRKSSTFNRFAQQNQNFEPAAGSENYAARITFFLSSQDECAALGPDWRSSFPADFEAINQACLRFPSYFFCVRFHPHQAEMPGDVEVPFEAIKHHKNLKLYPPSSQVNSYELIQWSDLTVTFASTVAVEACWMGKPVVQLGPSFFDQLGISYTPRTMEEFFDLLEQRTLAPCDRSNAGRYACFVINDFDTIRHLQGNKGGNRVIGMKPHLRIGTRLSKQLNNFTRALLKLSYRRAA